MITDIPSLSLEHPGVGGGECSLPQFPSQPVGKSDTSSLHRHALEELGIAVIRARGFYPQ